MNEDTELLDRYANGQSEVVRKRPRTFTGATDVPMQAGRKMCIRRPAARPTSGRENRPGPTRASPRSPGNAHARHWATGDASRPERATRWLWTTDPASALQERLENRPADALAPAASRRLSDSPADPDDK